MDKIFKHTICYPDQSKIERPEKLLDKNEAFELAKNYPWLSQVQLMNGMPSDDVYYSPSLEFIETIEGRSLTLTAELENDELDFSLWYIRPIEIKVFFGLLGKNTRKKGINKWSVSLEESLNCLELFLDKKFDAVESIVNS